MRGAIAVLFAIAIASDARAAGTGGGAPALQSNAPRSVDSVAVRFTAAEAGGSAHPRFITRRELALHARLLASAEEGGFAEPAARHARSAVELLVVIDMLSRLPLSPEPDASALLRVSRLLESALVDRLGGKETLARVADAEGIDSAEIDSALVREARAALYVERAISPVLYPTDDGLREVFRTAAHPFRGRPFEAAREPLSRWFALERLRAVETQYLQNARTRVHITYL